MPIFNQGKKFLFYGILNFAITNIILQILLLFINVWSSAILSQIINSLIGYRLYGRYVFKVNTFKNSLFLKYILLAFFTYVLNAKLIILISTNFVISKNLAAFTLVPFLASFRLFLKNFFFKQ